MPYVEDAEELAATEKRRQHWRFRADFIHDLSLPADTWAIDGEVQDEDPTEEKLLAVCNAAGARKLRITCSAPIHLDLCRIIGFMPPYAQGGQR